MSYEKIGIGGTQLALSVMSMNDREIVRSTAMSDDQTQGTVDNLKGKAQETLGNVTGNEQDQAQGKGSQVKGDAEKAVGNVKDAASNLTDNS